MDPEPLYQTLRVFATAALYTFIGVVLWLLWKDINATQRLISTNIEPAGQLLELSSEQSHPLMPVTSLGRATTNVVTISDPAISLEHALITRRDGIWWLEDLHSRNGTHLNSQPIELPAVITSGDIITIGHSHFKVQIRPISS